MIGNVTSAWSVAAEKSARFADPTMAAAERSVTSGGGLLQIFFSLLVVLAAVFVIAWVVRRMKVTPRSRVGHLKVIDEVVLGNKERAVVLEAEGTRLVLGVVRVESLCCTGIRRPSLRMSQSIMARRHRPRRRAF
jgi:flagellar protein FliO/FliZ